MNWKKTIANIKSGIFREDDVCPWWLAYSFDNPLRRFLHKPEQLLVPYVRPGMKVADIGCGMGYFSVPMAAMVGKNGKVFAADIQQKMLDRLEKRARKRGVAGIIQPVLAARDDIRIAGQVDFVLLFWMTHETGDILRFLRQVSSIVGQQGTVMIAEPRMHVSERKFREILRLAEEAGFEAGSGPNVRISRSALLKKR